MATYSYAQLEQLWINNDGPRLVAPVAAAIALAESSGNDQAVNKTDNNGTQTSWGLWQISNGTHSQPVANILDPNVNARQAVAKYKAAGNSFTPWGTYTSGAYKANLKASTTPDPNVPTTAGSRGSSSTGTATGSSTVGGGSTTAAAPTVQTVAQAQASAASSSQTCLLGFTSPSFLGIGGGTVCFLSKSQMRALVGGTMLLAGGVVFLVGAVLIVGIGLEKSGALNMVPGPVGQAAGAVSRQVSGEAGVARRERKIGATERRRKVEARERREQLRAQP